MERIRVEGLERTVPRTCEGKGKDDLDYGTWIVYIEAVGNWCGVDNWDEVTEIEGMRMAAEYSE